MERKELGREEEDLLERSVKKAKDAFVEDATMDEEMVDKATKEKGALGTHPPEGASETTKSSAISPGRRIVSYKDIVLQLNGDEDEGYSDEEDWVTIQRREEEEDEDLEEEAPANQANPLCPVYYFSEKQYKEDCKRWRKALIVKLLGRRISNRYLMTRLLKIWGLSGGIEVIDLDNGFILVNFHEEKDYFHGLHEGPWIMVDHYVVVQK